MKHIITVTLAGLLLLLVAILFGVSRLVANQQMVEAVGLEAERLRFQLIKNEPIAGSDGGVILEGWSAMVFKDRATQQCFITFQHGNAMSAFHGVTCAGSGNADATPFALQVVDRKLPHYCRHR